MNKKLTEQMEWVDSLRSRKPHFFNRVKLGYEWNRINQAHYDPNDPPPRDVMGYRFNIFYPNLSDKQVVPTYKITLCENPEHCVIRFTAGIPYEDIQFKIVNKKWDMADRKTFKCVFDRGILHLYFDFERYDFKR